jgi:hypothetical protein
MGAGETFREFRALALDEVRRGAEEAERRPRGSEARELPGEDAAWRRLYRDLRRAKASSVAQLNRETLEKHASLLGYGYFIRSGRKDSFMPFEGG